MHPSVSCAALKGSDGGKLVGRVGGSAGREDFSGARLALEYAAVLRVSLSVGREGVAVAEESFKHSNSC
ncbi:hypothetical protein KC324_g10 [Hortaea werneckii]|nr:hypothetical protein KC324_g10 [Hortaea werneckii]